MFAITQEKEGFTHVVYNGTCVEFESHHLTSLKTHFAKEVNKHISRIPGASSLMAGTCKDMGYNHEYHNPLFKKHVHGMTVTAWLI